MFSRGVVEWDIAGSNPGRTNVNLGVSPPSLVQSALLKKLALIHIDLYLKSLLPQSIVQTWMQYTKPIALISLCIFLPPDN